MMLVVRAGRVGEGARAVLEDRRIEAVIFSVKGGEEMRPTHFVAEMVEMLVMAAVLRDIEKYATETRRFGMTHSKERATADLRRVLHGMARGYISFVTTAADGIV